MGSAPLPAGAGQGGVVDAAVRRAVTLTAVAEGVPLGWGRSWTYTPEDAADLLRGPDPLVYPQRDQSGVPLPSLGDLAERVQQAVAEDQPRVTA